MVKFQIDGMGRHEMIFQQSQVGVNTGPAMLFGTLYHRGSDRIELDVAIDRHQVAFGVDQTGFESPLPECAAATVTPVEGLHVALTNVAHGSGQGVRLWRG